MNVFVPSPCFPLLCLVAAFKKATLLDATRATPWEKDKSLAKNDTKSFGRGTCRSNSDHAASDSASARILNGKGIGILVDIVQKACYNHEGHRNTSSKEKTNSGDDVIYTTVERQLWEFVFATSKVARKALPVFHRLC
ncbi:hypothetical protein EDB85DRAFT_1892588 [Lactarius pseudohatsudake]|nr:hypothetical protein EDB85DRAFT_1892588 [Lactarius pseudohatsudake]